MRSAPTRRIAATILIALAASVAAAQQPGGEARLKAMNIAFEADRLVQFAGQGDAAVVDAFLDAGMSPGAVERRYGATALINASANGHMRIVTRLLAAGAPVDQADKSGTTALVAAAYTGKQAVVELLLSKGASPNPVAGSRTMSPLQAGIANGNTKVVEALLKAGADPVGSSLDGAPLVSAAYTGRVELLKLLLATNPPAAVVRRALGAAEEAKHPQAQALLEERFKR